MLPIVPDIIHGQHHMETMIAVLSFPSTPAVFFCHGTVPWQECPPVHPRILRYVALSKLTARRLHIERNLPAERIETIPNHIDLSSFPAHPPRTLLKRAAVCSRTAPDPSMVSAIRGICEPRGISVDVFWNWTKGTVKDADKIFSDYDLVFSSGRTALEAMASGCVVSTVTENRLGPLIGWDNFAERRDFNFSLALWEHSSTDEKLGKQLDAFQPAAHRRMVDHIRSSYGIDAGTELAIQVYEKALVEWKTLSLEPIGERLAIRDYLCALAPLYDVYDAENNRARAEAASLRESLSKHFADLGTQRDLNQKKLAASQQQTAVLRGQLRMIQDLLARSPLLKIWFRSVRKTLRGIK